MWPYSLFHNKRLKLNKIYPLYSTLLHIFYFLLITFRRGIPAKFFVPSLYHLPAISRKAGLKLTHLVYFWLNQGISGGVENLKSINHKVHNPEYSGFAKVAKNYITRFWLCSLCAFFTHQIRQLAEKVDLVCFVVKKIFGKFESSS